MAINLGLTQAEMSAYLALLQTHHTIDIEIRLTDLSNNSLGDVSSMLLGGQVSIDSTSDQTTRALTMELLDPNHKLKLDSDAPEDGSIFFTRQAEVIYAIRNPEKTMRFEVPIFCGPLTKVDRIGPVITLEGQGKEKLSMGTVWKGKSYKKGLSKTWVIKDILVDLGGETKRRIRIPDRDAKLPNKVSVDKERTAWTVARSIAQSMGYQLFYDGAGYCRMRKVPSKTVFVWNQKGALLSNPQVGFSVDEVINAVEVIGGKPKGSKTKITHREVAPQNHPLSPWKMGRFGKPRYYPEVIEDESIKSKKDARKIAKKRLKASLIEQVEVSFESLPIPHLEENDLCRVNSDEFTGTFRLRQMTIPLTADGKATVGYIARVKPSKKSVRIRSALRSSHQIRRS